MSSITNKPNIPNVALITVGLDPKLAADIADVAAKMLWAVNRADCEGYISADKRPPFPQAVKTSQVCVAVIDFDKDMDQAVESASYIQELYPGKTALIASSGAHDHEVLLQAMRSGCNDFIGGEFDEGAFLGTLDRINQQWNAKRPITRSWGRCLPSSGRKAE